MKLTRRDFKKKIAKNDRSYQLGEDRMRDYVVFCAIYSNRISVIPCIHAEDLGENLRRASRRMP